MSSSRRPMALSELAELAQPLLPYAEEKEFIAIDIRAEKSNIQATNSLKMIEQNHSHLEKKLNRIATMIFQLEQQSLLDLLNHQRNEKKKKNYLRQKKISHLLSFGFYAIAVTIMIGDLIKMINKGLDDESRLQNFAETAASINLTPKVQTCGDLLDYYNLNPLRLKPDQSKCYDYVETIQSPDNICTNLLKDICDLNYESISDVLISFLGLSIPITSMMWCYKRRIWWEKEIFDKIDLLSDFQFHELSAKNQSKIRQCDISVVEQDNLNKILSKLITKKSQLSFLIEESSRAIRRHALIAGDNKASGPIQLLLKSDGSKDLVNKIFRFAGLQPLKEETSALARYTFLNHSRAKANRRYEIIASLVPPLNYEPYKIYCYLDSERPANVSPADDDRYLKFIITNQYGEIIPFEPDYFYNHALLIQIKAMIISAPENQVAFSPNQKRFVYAATDFKFTGSNLNTFLTNLDKHRNADKKRILNSIFDFAGINSTVPGRQPVADPVSLVL